MRNSTAALTAVTVLVKLLAQKALLEEREYLNALACAAVAARRNGKSADADVLLQHVAGQN